VNTFTLAVAEGFVFYCFCLLGIRFYCFCLLGIRFYLHSYFFIYFFLPGAGIFSVLFFCHWGFVLFFLIIRRVFFPLFGVSVFVVQHYGRVSAFVWLQIGQVVGHKSVYEHFFRWTVKGWLDGCNIQCKEFMSFS
jgi:hypothetical protein